jgi:tRNA(Ile)-lysidine synthase
MMNSIQWPQPGRYIVAVSGGSDSVALLDLLAGRPEYDLVVAHFDHGLRPDSAQDAALVQELAGAHGLPVVVEHGRLKRGSEAAARSARHAFLEQVRLKYEALAVVTAHHQDDLIETSLLNLARGTGRQGLAPMQNGSIARPLLGVSRQQLRDYATRHGLQWHEDSTNQDRANPRNFVRHELLSRADDDWRGRYLALITQLASLNDTIEAHLGVVSGGEKATDYQLPRDLVRALSLAELSELIVSLARRLVPGLELDARLVAEVALFAKTGRPGTRRPLRQAVWVVVNRDLVSVCLSNA